jgi:large subunit ribosomal protein L31
MWGMKTGIHPQYSQATVTCVCGNTYSVGSTKQKIDVEICSACHPFFTGEMKFVDTLGRVEKFQRKQQATAGQTYISKTAKKALRKKEQEDAEQAKPKNLKEMMDRVKN